MQVDILEWGRVLGSLEKELQAQLWEGWWEIAGGPKAGLERCLQEKKWT